MSVTHTTDAKRENLECKACLVTVGNAKQALHSSQPSYFLRSIYCNL